MKKRSTNLKAILITMLRNGRIYSVAASLGRLPVAAKHEAKKKTLIQELKVLDRQETAWHRRMQAAADKLDKLSIEKKLV